MSRTGTARIAAGALSSLLLVGLALPAQADELPDGTVGALDLTVGTVQQIVNPENMAPGRSYVQRLPIQNTGSVDLLYNSQVFVSGTRGIAAAKQANRDAAQESDEDGEAQRDGAGGAFPRLIVTLYVDADGNGKASSDEVFFQSGDVSELLEKSHGHGALLTTAVFSTPRYLASPTDAYVYRSADLNRILNPTDPSQLVTSEDLSVQVDYVEGADQNNEQAGTISLRFLQTAVQVTEPAEAAPAPPAQNSPPTAKTGWSVPEVLESPMTSVPLFVLALGAVYLVWRRRRNVQGSARS